MITKLAKLKLGGTCRAVRAAAWARLCLDQIDSAMHIAFCLFVLLLLFQPSKQCTLLEWETQQIQPLLLTLPTCLLYIIIWAQRIKYRLMVGTCFLDTFKAPGVAEQTRRLFHYTKGTAEIMSFLLFHPYDLWNRGESRAPDQYTSTCGLGSGCLASL